MGERAEVVFTGKVQGVYFRTNCRKMALDMRLTGYVENLPNGTVKAVFEGTKQDISRAIEWNRTSQPHAAVDEVDVTWHPATGEYPTFAIK